MSSKRLWHAAVLASAFLSFSHALAKKPAVAPLSAVDHATTWLNSKPLTSADLRGRVVLVDFWTYTCINWRRTLPWLRAWDERYRKSGLLVLGVHTPEFSFEKDVDNVRAVSHDERVDYPIAIDSDQHIWNAFRNQYWPALYIVDAQGHIRYEQFGEGNYERLELLIRQLLEESGHPVEPTEPIPIEGNGAEASADWENLHSPETYVGYARADNFASPGGMYPGRPRAYALPASLKLNSWALAGKWQAENEFVVSGQSNGRIAFRFHARDVHVILGTDGREKPIRFRVTIDGRAPAVSHGLDIDADGVGTIVAPRMYHLIRQQQPVVDRLVEIEFLDQGARIYDFTFG